MILRDVMILYWAIPSLLVFWLGIWQGRKEHEGIPLKDLFVTIVMSILWPLGILLALIVTIGEKWDEKVVSSYHDVREKRKLRRGYDD